MNVTLKVRFAVNDFSENQKYFIDPWMEILVLQLLPFKNPEYAEKNNNYI